MIRRGSLPLSFMIRRLMMSRRPRSRIVCSGCVVGLMVVNSLPVAEEKKLESKTHRSLAEILGIPKRGEPVDQPKVAVVIDPKIAKVLRPHQIEGVKVTIPHDNLDTSFSTKRRRGKSMTGHMDVSWPTKWVSEKLYPLN